MLVKTDPRLRLAALLARPTSAASLAFIRIAFGLVVLWEAWRYLDPGHGWVDAYYVEPSLFFGYWPFEWVSPLPAPWIQLVFVALGIAGLAVSTGLFYRVCAPAVFVLLSYIFLLDKTRYLNHWYLMVLLAAVLTVVPAHRFWSLDARRRPELASRSVPLWSIVLVRAQVAVPYIMGGIAKLNSDWLAGRPLGEWVSDDTDFPLIGALFDEGWFVLALAYGALAFDLLVVPLLFTRWGRPVAMGAAVVFHLMNDRLFSIGVFPWMMILATTVLLPSDWPERVIARLRSRPSMASGAFLVGAWIGGVTGARFPGRFMLLPTVVSALGVGLVAFLAIEAWNRSDGGEPALDMGAPPSEGSTRPRARPHRMGREPGSVVVWGLALWIALQVMIPLRHLAIPGDVHWTEEGHRFSWHMKLRDKDAEASYLVAAPSGRTWELDTSMWLTATQERKVAARPDLIVQFAHAIEAEFAAAGHGDVAVTADVRVSLNQREPARLIDPAVDLTGIEYPWTAPAPWILPLDK